MIRINNIVLENFNKDAHYWLIKELSNDKKVQGYIDRDLFSFVKEPVGDSFEVGKTYVASIDGREVGIVGSMPDVLDNEIEIWLAVKKKLRDRGYGRILLSELTPYVLENLNDVNVVKLKICENNIASIKIASYNGFVLGDKDDDLKLSTYKFSSR